MSVNNGSLDRVTIHFIGIGVVFVLVLLSRFIMNLMQRGLPISHQPEENKAEGGTAKTKST